MKVLLCHNFYREPGGEDHSFANEAALLAARDVETVQFTLHSREAAAMSGPQIARKTIWNRDVYASLRALIARERPTLMHCTNTFPLISPSAHSAARAERLPVVQALRNYRMLCANALLYRDGRACEECVGRSVPWPSVVHGCYRDSRSASAVVATMLTVHRVRRTWARTVSMFYTPSEFARRMFIAGGFAADRLVVKPNFVRYEGPPGTGRGGYAVFVGRLAMEKGLDTLIEAWARLDLPVPLKLIGDGPLAGDVAAAAARDPRIEWLGRRTPDDVLKLVGEATCLIMPSVSYETFGRTIIEAFAMGTPVIASNLGAMAELVTPAQTGLLVPPRDSEALAQAVLRLVADDAGLARMRRAARATFEEKYTPARNFDLLMDIYQQVLGRPLASTAVPAIRQKGVA
ncbi:MAG: glycosyltransferase [Gemmatimonadota bacterium]